jgi:ribosome-associated heat shock protein Hsp15
MRIDRLLFFLRLAKSRALAQKMVEGGHIRIDGQRVTQCKHSVAVGQALTLVAHGQLRVIRLEQMPERRGPAPEAASMICDIQPPQVIDAGRE